jgi:FkbM family methyltransferase
LANYKAPLLTQTPELPRIYEEVFGYRNYGFFVEIGVGHTINCGSNTDFLADLGWEGLYFEPHPDYYKEALKRHLSNSVKIYNVGLGSEYRETVLLPGDTCFQHWHESFDRLGWLPPQYKSEYGSPEIKIIPVNEALKSAQCPSSFDLLSIDVEGYELNILTSYNFNTYRPRLVIVELRDLSPAFTSQQRLESAECVSVIQANGYRMIFRDELNAVFLDCS